MRPRQPAPGDRHFAGLSSAGARLTVVRRMHGSREKGALSPAPAAPGRSAQWRRWQRRVSWGGRPGWDPAHDAASEPERRAQPSFAALWAARHVFAREPEKKLLPAFVRGWRGGLLGDFEEVAAACDPLLPRHDHGRVRGNVEGPFVCLLTFSNIEL